MERLSWVARDHYRCFGHDFEVRATDAVFADLARRYLRPFRVDDPDLPPRDTYSAVCGETKTLPGGRSLRPVRRLYLGTLKIFKGVSYDEMAGRLVGSVRDLVTAHADEFVRLRAGGVVVDGRALLMPSEPSPHLPALVGLLVASGAAFLGDEMVFIDPVLGGVHGLAFPLLVDSRDLAHFPTVRRERGGRPPRGAPERIQGRTPRRPVAVDEIGGVAAASAELGRILVVRFAADEPTRIVPIDRAAAVFRVTRAVLNLHIWGERAVLLARRLVDTVPTDELVVGSVSDAAELLRETAPAALERR